MEFERVAALRQHSAAWRLMRADSAAMVLAILGQVFVVENHRTVVESQLVARVEELLDSVNQAAGGPDAAYPRSAKDYLDTWARPEVALLRKFYPEGQTEAAYDATSDLERAYRWVCELEKRAFVGTESRLHTVVDLLRQIVHGADADPAVRLDQLRRRRAELDLEIARAEAGDNPPLDTSALLDRLQHVERTARELLSDFREVEDNFRALDRGARELITGWEGGKGELLDLLVGDRHAIAASDQGRSFQAFHDFLLSRRRQDELTELLDALPTIPDLRADPRLQHIHEDWLVAAERTQQTVRQLSEQLRRFLDDKIWLENRRVMDLLRSIERTALAVRGSPVSSAPAAFTWLSAAAPRLALPMERPLYVPPPVDVLSDAGPDTSATDKMDATSLFEQTFVDLPRITATLRAALRRRGQVDLATHLREHPPTLGLAEIVAHLALAEDDIDVVVDDHHRVTIPYLTHDGLPRQLTLAQVTFVRASAAGPDGGARRHTSESA
ncbi:MAG: DUF3375 domain-containing protein [Austwickia sp.]|jgi:hypothetical protein|nr:MAG: DUF3375 domain-containing protein [Austwickia sp.]